MMGGDNKNKQNIYILVEQKKKKKTSNKIFTWRVWEKEQTLKYLHGGKKNLHGEGVRKNK